MTTVVAGLLDLGGRVAVVTGGCGGIGSATASLLQQAGADVVVTDRDERGAPSGCRVWPADLSDPAEVRRFAARLREDVGRLDLLVHACGTTRDGYLTRTSDEDWSTVMRTNLDSAFFLLRELTPMLRESSASSVVLISSINGERGKVGQSNYCASKAGLIGLSRTAAREFGGWGIRVNCLCPGLIDTSMTADLPADIREQALEEIALGRAGQPDDVAHCVLFLCSEMSRHVTGQVLRVDGGQLIA